MKTTTIIGFFILCIISCSKEKIEHDIIDLNIDVKKLSSVKDIFSDFHFVPLEIVDGKIIAEIDKIVFDSNYLYILDAKTNSIFIYNHKGKYINQIARRGRARDEYLSIDDMVVYDSHIYVLCRSSKKINVYSKDNKFIKSIPLNDWYMHFHILNESEMFLDSGDSNERNYNFILYDYQKGKELAFFDEFKANQSYGFSGVYPFNSYADDLLFVTKHFDMNVYLLKKTAMTPKYRLNFNTDYLIPKNANEMTKEKLSNLLRYKNVVTRIDEFKIDGEYIYMYYDIFLPSNGGSRTHITVVDKADNSSKTLLFRGDNDNKIPMIGEILSINNDYLVTYSSSFSAIKFDEVHKFNIFSELNLSENDNPLLFFYKFK